MTDKTLSVADKTKSLTDMVLFVADKVKSVTNKTVFFADKVKSLGDKIRSLTNKTKSRPAVSQHLRVLLDAGLVTEQRHGRERRYRLVPEQLAEVRDWLANYDRFWDDRLLRLQKQLSKGAKNE